MFLLEIHHGIVWTKTFVKMTFRIGILKLATSLFFCLFLRSGKKCLIWANTTLTMTLYFQGLSTWRVRVIQRFQRKKRELVKGKRNGAIKERGAASRPITETTDLGGRACIRSFTTACVPAPQHSLCHRHRGSPAAPLAGFYSHLQMCSVILLPKDKSVILK